MLSPDIQRLMKISEYCEDVANTVARCEGSFAKYSEDLDMQHSIAFSILQIGELVSKLSDETRAASADGMDWRGIRSVRNIVVHDYGKVRLDIIWDIACKDIPRLKEYCDSQIPEEDDFD